MVVVLSVMDGFEHELKKRLMATDLHVLIEPTSQVSGFNQGRVLESALDAGKVGEARTVRPEITAWDPILSTEAILRAGRKVAGVSVKGVKPDRIAKIQEGASKREGAPYLAPQKADATNPDGSAKASPIWIGQELSFELNVVPGDRIQMISPTEMEGPMGNVPRLRELVVGGIYSSGQPEQELHVVFAPIGTVRSFLRASDAVTQWELTVSKFDEAPDIAREIGRLFPQFKVQDWEQMNAHLFGALKLERLAMFVILAFIVIVASFNIVTTLTLMVLEKKREISILKTMGARDSEVSAIFLAEGLFIGSIGAGGGLVLSYILCLALKRYRLIELPNVFYDRTLPVSFEPGYYIGAALVALVIVLLSCLYPSQRAAELKPLEGIRFG